MLNSDICGLKKKKEENPGASISDAFYYCA